MPHLTLTLLGPPHLERDGQPVTLDTRKAMALLAYLAVTGQRHSRDALAALLYPDFDQSRARATLRRTLSSLKSAIGEPSLLIDRESIALAPDAGLWCDVTHFQRLLDECQGHGHSAHDICPRCLAPLHEAAALYQDDFLAGFTLRDSAAFDDWQRFESERLRRELLSALERLVRLLTTTGDLAAAIEQAQRLLASDPLHEPAHRVLMLLYVWTGQEQAALRQYRACVAALNEELGVAPLPATTQVYEAIKERRTPPPPASLRAAVRATTLPPAAPPSQSPAAAPSMPLPLTGRTDKLAALAALLGQVQADGRLAALEGEPGIGKTRLAEEFLRTATAAGAASLAGRCFEGEAGLAYSVWIDALRAAVARPTLAQRLLAAPDNALAEAARLVPELVAGRAQLPVAPLDHPGAQARFFDGLCHVLQTLVGSGGVLFLDDLHWADDASLEVLHYLVHRLAGRPLLVLAAWRSEDNPAVQRLRNLAREAQRAGLGGMLPLRRLTMDDVQGLVDALPGATSTPASLGQRLYRQSEGLPLFVAEYLAAWQADGAAGAETLPQGVRSLLQARLARVDAAGQQLLAAGAVIGRSFDFETLRATSGRSEEEIVDSLEMLVRHGLVQETNPSGPLDSYDFSHEQLRALVYAETGLARRRLLHRRVAEALQRQPRPAQGPGAAAGQIGYHLQLAGREQEAADYFWQAGQHARSLYANAEALAHFETALALGNPDAAALHEAIGDLHTLAGRYGPGRAAYEQAAVQALAGAQPARVERKLALLHHRQGDWTLAESHFQASHETWPAGDLAGQAHLLADRSLNAHRQGRQRQAGALAEEALQVAESAQDAASLARAHNALGLLARSRGDLASAAEHLGQGLAQAEALGDPSSRAAALNNLALVCQAQGDSTQAIQLTEQALALCEAQGDRHRAAALHNNLADLLHAAGQPDAAMDQLKQAVAIFAEIGEPGQPEIWKLVAW
jgi:DNA-binding SARP family transcriptional activator